MHVRSVVRIGMALTAVLLVAASAPAAKKKIEKRDDLPRHSYTLPMSGSEIVRSEDAIAKLAKQVRADLEADLASYDIADKTTVQGMQSALTTISLVQHRWDEALEHLKAARALEDKPAIKATMGLGTESRIAAIQATGSTDPAVFGPKFREEYEKRLAGLDWNVVADVLQQTKGQMEMISEPLVLGLIQEQVDPIVAKNPEVSRDIAVQLLSFRELLTQGLPVKGEAVAALQGLVDRNREEKQDIWAERSLDLAGRSDLTTTKIAVWDTGVDTAIFGKTNQLFTNPNEKADGKDDDGNGFVDDMHGIAFDLHNVRTTGNLYDMSGATRPVPTLQGWAKGLFDLQAAIDSPEAKQLRTEMSQLSQDEVKNFMEDLTRYTLYAHGTHVAGIAAAENPAARILYCRLTGDPRIIGEPPTMEDSENMAKAASDAVKYFRANGVRVVNMSWVVARSGIEAGLEQHNIGKDAEERKEMARRQFDVIREGLESAFRSAPEILFVGGAGNSNNDIEFDEFVPPMLQLDNLLIAGAVDQAGEATTFTSFGPTVNVYANGYEVESYVPGGDRLPFSGTSMASPNVANLAAKLFALDPNLTPSQVVSLILDNADVVQEGDETMRIINPRRSAEALLQANGKAL
ncbi:MAG: S8 family serine peptidase [bacterium]